MTKRIFRSICLAALAVLLASLTLIMGVLYSYFTQVQQRQLKIQTQLAARAVSLEGARYFEDLEVDNCRVTWIAPDGTVLYDTQKDSSVMENHLQREEIQQALASGFGQSKRYSATLMERYLYCAQRLADGSVIRLSSEQSAAWTLMMGMATPIALVILLAVALSLLLASRLSRRIVQPLNALNLDDPLSNEGYDELSPLLRRIDAQQRQLRQQAQQLHRKQDEFETITGSMKEGLVLVNAQGRLVSMNSAATRLLDAQWLGKGDDLLSANRSAELREVLDGAQDGRRVERVAYLHGGDYQIDATPVYSEGTLCGAAILLVDITQKRRAEALRREFTANVSHELKTPLQSICGYAELLADGMVKNEDVPHFSQRIYEEATRMTQLVEDVLRLSKLDDGAADMQRERVDLYDVAAGTLQRLESAAELKKVSCRLTGEHVEVLGVRQLLSGIVFNLCDNAIKYNRPDGSVAVSLGLEDGWAVLTVSDTGIGIPMEHQARVFERFYRVDKSRSKAAGGTGLGLSIVKHAVLIHGGKLELHSVPGEGTRITVRLPGGNLLK